MHLRNRDARRAGQDFRGIGCAAGLWRYVVPEPIRGGFDRLGKTAGRSRRRHCLTCLQYRDRRCHSLCLEEAGQAHCGGALLPSGSRFSIAQKQGKGVGRSPGRNLAPSTAYAGVRQPDYECAAVLAAGSAWVDRKSTRLNSVTNANLVCRLLLENKKQKK